MPTPPQTLSARLRKVEDQFFVAGQMDAQGTACEKFHVGSGGTVLAMSQRLLDEGRAVVEDAAAELDRRDALVTAAEAIAAELEAASDPRFKVRGNDLIAWARRVRALLPPPDSAEEAKLRWQAEIAMSLSQKK